MEYTYLLFWNSFWTIAPVIGIGLFDRIAGEQKDELLRANWCVPYQMILSLWPSPNFIALVGKGGGSGLECSSFTWLTAFIRWDYHFLAPRKYGLFLVEVGCYILYHTVCLLLANSSFRWIWGCVVRVLHCTPILLVIFSFTDTFVTDDGDCCRHGCQPL